jgi:hypothetical protein
LCRGNSFLTAVSLPRSDIPLIPARRLSCPSTEREAKYFRRT